MEIRAKALNHNASAYITCPKAPCLQDSIFWKPVHASFVPAQLLRTLPVDFLMYFQQHHTMYWNHRLIAIAGQLHIGMRP